jgi:small subunit ribosomal protein S20
VAHTKSAKKQIRKAQRQWLRNRYQKGQLRSAVKQLRQAIEEQDGTHAQALVPEAVSRLDKAAKNHVIHKNKAARLKSRLMRQANSLKK